MLKNNKGIYYCIIFILLLLPCIIVTFTNSSLLNDAANWILNALSSFSDGRWYIENNFDHRARMSVLFLHFLPLNIAYFLFKINSFNSLVHIYSATLVILPTISCLYSVYLFYRAEKFNLALFPLFILSTGIFPVITYGCVECFLTVVLFFILFQYFYLNLKLKLLDYIIFILIVILAYDLHECIVIIYPIIVLTYFKNSNRNNLLKFGLISLTLAFIMYFIFAFTNIGPKLLSDNAVNSIFYFLYPPLFTDNMINFHCLFYLLFLLNFFVICISNNKKIPYIISILSGILLIGSFKYWFLAYYVMYRFLCIFITCIFMLILIFAKSEFLNRFAKNSVLYLVLSLIVSNMFIFEFSRQFNEFEKRISLVSQKAVFYMKDKKEVFGNLPIYRYNMSDYGNIEQIAYSIIAVYSNKNTSPKGIIIGEDANGIIPSYCNDTLYVEGGALHIKMKTKFWDISQFKPYFKEKCK